MTTPLTPSYANLYNTVNFRHFSSYEFKHKHSFTQLEGFAATIDPPAKKVATVELKIGVSNT